MQSSAWLDLLMLLSLPMAAGNDLLDFVAVDRYWQELKTPVTVDTMIRELRTDPPPDVTPLIRQLGNDEFQRREEAMRNLAARGATIVDALETAARSPDEEIADRARQLLKQVGTAHRAAAERQLMAIRTLAELKDAAAVPPLKKLLDRREPFVAEYAQAAIAAIENRSYSRPRPTDAELEQDLAAVPGDSATVGQLALRQNLPFRFDAEVARQVAFLEEGFARARLLHVARSLAPLAERVTNLRIDAVTIASGAPPAKATARDGDGLWQVFVIRGLYDPPALRDLLVEIGGAVATQKGVEVVTLADSGMHVALWSPRLLLAVSGPPGDRAGILPAALKSLKNQRRQVAAESAVGKLLAKVDRRAPAWAVAALNDVQRRDPLWQPFESWTLVIQHTGKGLTVQATTKLAGGQSGDIAAVQWNQQIETWLRPHARLADRGDAQRRPLVELLKSVRIASRDGAVVATAAITDLEAFLAVPLSMQARWDY